jgi:DNA (cytosine-5)-methyltransferase 1
VLGTDIDQVALETFRANHSQHGVTPITIAGDIRDLKPAEVVDHLSPLGLAKKGAVDVLMGGPPCEGFSQNRRHEIHLEDGSRIFTRNPLDSRDPRNELFRYYLALAEVMRPRAILIENVPQMTTSHGGAFIAEIESTLSRLGYRTRWRVLTATDYGVPQIRKRAFVIGVDETCSDFEWPLPTHGLANGLVPFVTVRDAIGDLPDAGTYEKGRTPIGDYRAASSGFARSMRSELATPMNHVQRRPGESVLNRLRAMRPGMIAAELPDELRPKSHFYNSYGRLDWDKPAKTITKSCNYLGSGCFGHPELDRGITMREAARLQSFDDDFSFLSASEPHVAKMVGSAVPPVLSRALGSQLAKALA